MPATPVHSLNHSTRTAIALIALLQGLMLHAAQVLSYLPPFQNIGWRYGWYAWTLAIPTAVALSLIELRQRRLWLHAALASLIVWAMAAWVGWNLSGESTLQAGTLKTPFSLGVAVAVFVALPWWQFQLRHGHWRADYYDLFQQAWHNGLTLVLAALFTLLTWVLLKLWAALFLLLHVGFFRNLFEQELFVSLTTGVLIGFGILIGRTQQRAIEITRQILFAVCRGLLPLLSLIAVLFVLSLPLIGLGPLWATHSAVGLLLTLAMLLVGFANAVYQDGRQAPPYPSVIRRLVEASLLTLPVYAGLALYVLVLRSAQHGWTTGRVWAVLTALLVTGYALGYAWAVLRRRGPWLQTLEPVNRWMCWIVLAVAILGNSPLLDPVRITLSSQLPRLRADPARITAADAAMLRFDLGRRGVAALRQLQREPAVAADGKTSALLARILKSESRSLRSEDIDNGLHDAAALRQRLHLAQGSSSPPADWWQALAKRQLGKPSCLKADSDCVVFGRDLDDDGSDEVMLCDLSHWEGPACDLYARTDARWQLAGNILFKSPGLGKNCALCQALLQGRLTTLPPRWPMLSVDGRTPLPVTPAPDRPPRPPDESSR